MWRNVWRSETGRKNLRSLSSRSLEGRGDASLRTLPEQRPNCFSDHSEVSRASIGLASETEDLGLRRLQDEDLRCRNNRNRIFRKENRDRQHLSPVCMNLSDGPWGGATSAPDAPNF